MNVFAETSDDAMLRRIVRGWMKMNMNVAAEATTREMDTIAKVNLIIALFQRLTTPDVTEEIIRLWLYECEHLQNYQSTLWLGSF